MEDDSGQDAPGECRAVGQRDADQDGRDELEGLVGDGVATQEVDDVAESERDARDDDRALKGATGPEGLEKEASEEKFLDEPDRGYEQDRGRDRLQVQARGEPPIWDSLSSPLWPEPCSQMTSGKRWVASNFGLPQSW